jgi:aminoglycoside phosphotransferase (APT) family kinase protein
MVQAAPDPFAVLAALGFPGAASAEPVGGGSDTLIWRVDHDRERYALRVFRPEQAAMCRREVVAMAAAAAGGVPVPRVHATGAWRDRPALLLSWSPGRPLADELRDRPWRAWPLGLRFGRTQAAIHALPAPPPLLDHPVPWRAWAGADAALEACLRAVAPWEDALLHLDYHPMNVMVDGDRVTAVLDWANARSGDPRADLARTAAILRFAPAARTTLRLLEAGWRHGYRRAAGPVDGMAPFSAWAGAVMERDLAPRLGRPDLPWLTPEYLARVRRWTADRRARAGCEDGVPDEPTPRSGPAARPAPSRRSTRRRPSAG